MINKRFKNKFFLKNKAKILAIKRLINLRLKLNDFSC